MNTTEKHLELLFQLYKDHFGETPTESAPLPLHASVRQYFKLSSDSHTALGAINTNVAENKAFIALDTHLQQKGIHVPKVYSHSDDWTTYLQEYVSAKDLFSLLESTSGNCHNVLGKVIDQLILLQSTGADGWDFADSYPHPSFGAEEVQRDWLRFVEHLLAEFDIDEDSLDTDRTLLTELIATIPEYYYTLMHRDFKSQNILLREDTPYLIDFQSARRGPVFYDLASFVYDPDAALNNEQQQWIINYYLKQSGIATKDFQQYFHVVGIARLVQIMGAYGLAIFKNNKIGYQDKLSRAVATTRQVLKLLNDEQNIQLPQLSNVLDTLSDKLEA